MFTVNALRAQLAAAAGSALLGAATSAQTWVPAASLTPPGEPLPATQPGFLDEVLVGDFENAIGMALAPDGRAYVWERAGMVWVIEDGVKLAEPFLDIRDEVRHWGDHSLQGLVLDPDFMSNGYVYLYYAVDWHHVEFFGTPGYDPDVSELARDSIARVTRYTGDAGDGFRTADLSTRLVLLGDSVADGVPVCGTSHGPGSIAFGTDGSLIVSTGDGDAAPASETCFSDGILDPNEDVGKFRAQVVDSLAGKLLRIDPTTGDGLPSNPFYDPLEPRAARSRVWSLGLRQPFRFAVRPGSGSSNPADGLPGMIAVGEVGEGWAECLEIVDGPGQNFGWPIWEGLDLDPAYSPQLVGNIDAPNPLFGSSVPGVGDCGLEFFRFQDLIAEDSQNPPSWPNPCDPAQQITSVPTFVHRRPVVEWHDFDTATRVPIFDAFGEAGSALLGDPGVAAGEGFSGNCSVGGTWYDGMSFPVEHHGSYFHGDFGEGWIKEFRFNSAGQLLEVLPFAQPVGRVVDMAVHPIDGSLWYMDLTNLGGSTVHRVRHVVGDVPPTAVPKLPVPYGYGPIAVVFDGQDSSDPEGGALDHAWDFGALPPSRLSTVVRTLPSEDITDQGTIVARLFELDPPVPMGSGAGTPEVIRDDDYPPLHGEDDDRQYTTAHWDTQTFSPDKGGIDWIGYTFPSEHSFHGMYFEEGKVYASLGGWWNTLEVQVRQAGSWNTVHGLVSDPPYPGDLFPNFEAFEFRFPPTTGDGIRLYGIPGGQLEFVTVAELRVLAEPVPEVTAPALVPGTLTVTDPAGGTHSDSVSFSLNNLPPLVEIIKPRNLAVYANDAPATVTLTPAYLDPEHGTHQLEVMWQVILHHDDHSHPGPLLLEPSPEVQLSSDGCPDVHYQEVRLTVTDALGLSTTVSHYLIPACDLNHNGVDDALDIAVGTSLDLDADGVPDEVPPDCDGDGIEDIHAIFFGWVRDDDGDGVPDDCDHAGGGVSPRGPAPQPGPGSSGGPGGGSLGSGDGVLGDG